MKKVQIAYLGLNSLFGKVATNLLKQSPSIQRLTFYDDSEPIKSFDPPTSAYFGTNSLFDAIKDVDIVVIGEEECDGKKALEDHLELIAPKILRYTKAILEYSPNAVIVVATSPLNVIFPLVGHLLGPDFKPRLLGTTSIDTIRASRIFSNILGEVNKEVPRILPIVGGASHWTRVPLFSCRSPERFEVNQEIREKVLNTMREFDKPSFKELDSVERAYGTVRFIHSIISGMAKSSQVIDMAMMKTNLIPGVEYFSLPIVLGPRGIESTIRMPNLDANEKKMLDFATESLLNESQKARHFIEKWDNEVATGPYEPLAVTSSPADVTSRQTPLKEMSFEVEESKGIRKTTSSTENPRRAHETSAKSPILKWHWNRIDNLEKIYSEKSIGKKELLVGKTKNRGAMSSCQSSRNIMKGDGKGRAKIAKRKSPALSSSKKDKGPSTPSLSGGIRKMNVSEGLVTSKAHEGAKPRIQSKSKRVKTTSHAKVSRTKRKQPCKVTESKENVTCKNNSTPKSGRTSQRANQRKGASEPGNTNHSNIEHSKIRRRAKRRNRSIKRNSLQNFINTESAAKDRLQFDEVVPKRSGTKAIVGDQKEGFITYEAVSNGQNAAGKKLEDKNESVGKVEQCINDEVIKEKTNQNPAQIIIKDQKENVVQSNDVTTHAQSHDTLEKAPSKDSQINLEDQKTPSANLRNQSAIEMMRWQINDDFGRNANEPDASRTEAAEKPEIKPKVVEKSAEESNQLKKECSNQQQDRRSVIQEMNWRISETSDLKVEDDPSKSKLVNQQKEVDTKSIEQKPAQNRASDAQFFSIFKDNPSDEPPIMKEFAAQENEKSTHCKLRAKEQLKWPENCEQVSNQAELEGALARKQNRVKRESGIQQYKYVRNDEDNKGASDKRRQKLSIESSQKCESKPNEGSESRTTRGNARGAEGNLFIVKMAKNELEEAIPFVDKRSRPDHGPKPENESVDEGEKWLMRQHQELFKNRARGTHRINERIAGKDRIRQDLNVVQTEPRGYVKENAQRDRNKITGRQTTAERNRLVEEQSVPVQNLQKNQPPKLNRTLREPIDKLADDRKKMEDIVRENVKKIVHDGKPVDRSAKSNKMMKNALSYKRKIQNTSRDLKEDHSKNKFIRPTKQPSGEKRKNNDAKRNLRSKSDLTNLKRAEVELKAQNEQKNNLIEPASKYFAPSGEEPSNKNEQSKTSQVQKDVKKTLRSLSGQQISKDFDKTTELTKNRDYWDSKYFTKASEAFFKMFRDAVSIQNVSTDLSTQGDKLEKSQKMDTMLNRRECEVQTKKQAKQGCVSRKKIKAVKGVVKKQKSRKEAVSGSQKAAIKTVSVEEAPKSRAHQSTPVHSEESKSDLPQNETPTVDGSLKTEDKALNIDSLFQESSEIPITASKLNASRDKSVDCGNASAPKGKDVLNVTDFRVYPAKLVESPKPRKTTTSPHIAVEKPPQSRKIRVPISSKLIKQVSSPNAEYISKKTAKEDFEKPKKSERICSIFKEIVLKELGEASALKPASVFAAPFKSEKRQFQVKKPLTSPKSRQKTKVDKEVERKRLKTKKIDVQLSTECEGAQRTSKNVPKKVVNYFNQRGMASLFFEKPFEPNFSVNSYKKVH